jgi:hypothetical protein
LLRADVSAGLPFDFQVVTFSLVYFVLGSGMNEPSTVAAPMALPAKLELAQQTFERFYYHCFWFMRKDLRVGEEDLEWIVQGLRSHGNREAFLIAAKLCR